MKLSVIVPVYNVEKFLPRCLDSLLRQGLEVGEYEVICVNDGSPDNCAQILAEYEQKYPGIFRVITQENRGLGEARNTGMKAAQGEYIAFVDSDDYVANGGYAYICQHFLKKKPDVVSFLSRRVNSSDIDKLEHLAVEGMVAFEGKGAEVYGRLQYMSAWSKFYRRAFLLENDIWFEKILAEDQIFNFLVFSRNPYVVLINCDVYRYMQDNGESIMTTKNKEKVRKLMDDQLYGMSVLKRYLDEGKIQLLEGLKKSICNYLDNFYSKSYDAHLSFKEWRQYMRPIREMGINRILLEREKTTLGKVIVMLKCMSGQSFLMYRIIGCFHRNVFEKYLLNQK